MRSEWGRLEKLAGQIATGDLGAESTFRAQMEPALARATQRVLSTRADVSPLALRIRAVADQVAPAPWQPARETQKQLVAEIARVLCETVIRRLREELPGRRGLAETLCDCRGEN